MDRSEPYVGHLGGCASLPQLGSCRAVRLGPVAVAPTCRATNRQTSAQEHCDSLFRPIQKRQQHRDRRELDIHAAIPCQFLEPRPWNRFPGQVLKASPKRAHSFRARTPQTPTSVASKMSQSLGSIFGLHGSLLRRR